MASCLKLMLKCLAFIGIILAFLFILDIFSLVFTIQTDSNKDWKFIALLALIVSAFTLWGTDSKNPHVLAYAVDTAFITITLYYTIELDDIIDEFSDLSGSALFKAIGLRLLVLLAAIIIIAMIAGYQMTVQLEHVLLLRGQITSNNNEYSRPRPDASQNPPKSKSISDTSDTSKSIQSKSNKSRSDPPKSSRKVVQNVHPGDDETEGDWDDEEEGEEEDDEQPSPSDVHQSAKSFSSQFLERPSSRISGSTANSSVTSKPSPTTNSGVPTKSSY